MAQKRVGIVLAVTLVACLAAVAVQAQDAVAPLPPPPRAGGLFSFEPMVDTGVSELGGRFVSVHLPGVFDLKLDTRPNHGGARMRQTVMSGLVTVELDRTRQPDGRSTGPIDVKVMGFTVYKNKEAQQARGSTLTNPLSELTSNLPSISA